MAKRKSIRVIYKKKAKNWGEAFLGDNLIELDSRLKGKKHLEILIHEAIHILYPVAEEDEVVAKSITLTNLLWTQGYRRVENDCSEPLQDGKK